MGVRAGGGGGAGFGSGVNPEVTKATKGMSYDDVRKVTTIKDITGGDAKQIANYVKSHPNASVTDVVSALM